MVEPEGVALRLAEWAKRRRASIAWGPAAELCSARRAVLGLREDGLLDAVFFRDQLEPVAGEPDQLPEWARTVIVAAVPSPAFTVAFTTSAGSVTALLPPTYVHYHRTHDAVAGEILAALGPERRVELTRGPVKTLAVRLGLASWGRNNITYSGRLGSYHQLVGVLSDAPLVPARRRGPAATAGLQECDGCSSCASVCPTGAIDEDRFVISAHRCLVAVNEVPGPWPAWVPARAHNCLIGCMVCQEACPANAGLLAVANSSVTFDERETNSVLTEDPGDTPPWQAIRQKLESIGRKNDLPILGRNLRALLADRR